jgi:adenosylcobinamide-phosphate synthase
MLKINLLAMMAGFLIDCLLGDPKSMPHPVGFIGTAISFFEKAYRRLFSKTEKGEFAAGITMTVTMLMSTSFVSGALLALCRLAGKWLYFALASIMCWQIIAAKCLKDESMKVYAALKNKDLPAARKQVGMLVGRDTEKLTEAEVIRAAVETVAENSSDGVVAPMFWTLIGGPVGGMLYKAVNTMDSMVGYKNEKYIMFGRFSAKLDDAVNYIPARLSALAMILAAGIGGFDAVNAFRIWKRDRRNHSSPNSAQTEAACAGALHIQLGGRASYFGKVQEKPRQGDPDRALEADDIIRACKLMHITSALMLLVYQLIGWLIAAM